MRVRVLALTALLACGVGSSQQALPPELLGVWRTNAPAYRDRSLELRPDWVVFGTSAYTSTMHPIESVHTEPLGDSTLVVIGYRVDDGAVLELRLEWTPGAPNLLRVGRREDVWVPETSATWLKESAL